MTPSDFPWRPGMLAYPRGRGTPFRIVALRPATDRKPATVFLVRPTLTVGTWELVEDLYDADLIDAPTKGALLEAVREAYGDPTAYAMPEGDEWVVWAHIPGDDTPGKDGVGDGPTEGAALLAAWKARPR